MSANGNGHHWSKFCWRDWQSDVALRSCSLGARGFWLECLAAMHEADPVGYLTFNGRAATMKQMATNANCTLKEAERFFGELEEAGVFSRAENGTIFCRRMVRDAQASDIGREYAEKRWRAPNGGPNGGPNGHPNGEPNAKSQSQNQSKKGGPPKSPRKRGDFPPPKLSVTDQIRKDWGLGSFLRPDIRDDDDPPAIRLVS